MAEIARGLCIAGALLLLASGVGHARPPARVRALLRAHGIVPGPAVRGLAAALGPAQLTLGPIRASAH